MENLWENIDNLNMSQIISLYDKNRWKYLSRIFYDSYEHADFESL